ncbi:hypothetical protein B0H17DRAFT_1135742 [Mycena rosella]|uniref:Uncharacterized protein n=1 Tax=Mycena rosella TaxID=1033263 RepID=A0AAD7DFH2_MYCRO|nr:hypothetical protein B0H17DRAFT_1135742 [Mycena rosella]
MEGCWKLSALLWFPEIQDLAKYRRDLRVAVGNVLDIFATIDPSKIISKVKYPLLVHIDEDLVQCGPIIGLATELFESFNGVFRYCYILSNHLAPSRDIAIQLADQEGLKHRLTGGWWSSCSDGRWERAGRGRLVGWAEKKTVKHEKMYRRYSENVTRSIPAGFFETYISEMSETTFSGCSVGHCVHLADSI